MVKFPIVKKEEKRLDGKQAFTKGEFAAYYGEKEGARKWKSAEVSQKGDKRKVSYTQHPLSPLLCSNVRGNRTVMTLRFLVIWHALGISCHK